MPSSVPIWDAFWELNNDRQLSLGKGPIPFLSIDRYAVRYGIEDRDEFDAFRRLIRAMDRALLEGPGEGKPTEVSTTDVKGVKSLLRTLAKDRPQQDGEEND